MLQIHDNQYYAFDESEINDIRELDLKDAMFQIDILKYELHLALVEAKCWKDCYESARKSIINYVK